MEHTPRVLIVEDENILAFVLKNRFSKTLNAQCITTNTGEQAIELIKNNSFDLITMDICLAGELTGIDVMDQVHELLKFTPVIFTSASLDQDIIERIEKYQLTDYLNKPIDHNKLDRAVQLALGKLEVSL